jgi:glycosyltransferase involved in cell wall biosynthesis
MDINRVIQGFWTGPLSTMERLCIQSFLSNGHDFHLYTYGPLDGVPEGCIIKDANEIAPQNDIKKFQYLQQFSDYFRYALLRKNGGWWVDMDVICLKPFDFKEDYVFVESTGDRETGLNFAVIKVPTPNCELIEQCWATTMSMESQWLKTMNFQAIGPELWAKKIDSLKLGRYIQPIDKFDPIHWDRLIWSIDPTKKWDLTNCYALHLFHAAWNKGSQAAAIKSSDGGSPGTDGIYPEGCLYEILKKRYLHPPKVSVVITTINRSAQLRVTLDTIAKQNFTDFEVVIVDDGTDTETPALCKELWSFPLRYFRLDRMRSVEYHNQSVVANFGVRQAFGKIIVLQCAECKHVGNVLAELTAQVTPDNVVLCRADHLNQDGTINPEKTEYMNIVREKQALFFCGAIYKSWFEKLRGFDERYERFYGADDIDFSDRLLFSGAKFEYLTSSFVQHQWHPIPATTAAGGQSLLDSQKDAHAFLLKTTADMKAGLISPIRNQGREWGQITNVSIVITTFNRPELLQNTLASIRKQGVSNLEIIVVDDGTDDKTQNICAQFNATYIKVNRPQSDTYRNPARPINIGIRYSKGDIIILQNAECVHIDPEAIKKLITQVTDKNAVFAWVMGLKPDGTPDHLFCGASSRRPYFFCGAMKRYWFEQLRGMDEDYPGGGYDDDDFADRLKKSGVEIVYSDIAVNHQWHPHLGKLDTLTPLNVYKQKTEDMAAGKITPVRNLGRDWGALEPNSLVISAKRECSSDFKGSYWGTKFTGTPYTKTWKANVAPTAPVSVSTGRGYRYDHSGLVTNWWDRHNRR